MKRAVILTLLVLFSGLSFAQFQASPRTITLDPKPPVFPMDGQLNKKSPATLRTCGQDTLEYGYIKASALVGISISQGYSLGQFYEAPDTVTVSGFRFYGWGVMNNADSVAIFCELYASTTDSLPTGSPIRSDTIYVDSTFGSGTLAGLTHLASWTPYKTTDPFILVVRSNDSNRVAIVTNSYSNQDGQGENLASGSVGGTWYNALNLNIGGVRLDCDILLEPYVDYTIFNDFKFDDCYLTYDTVHYTNTSSPIMFSPMYNRYEAYGLGRYSHRWDYGGGFFQYAPTPDGFSIYTNYQNRTIRLVSNMYQYSGNNQCIDTTIKALHFQPSPIKFTGIPSAICTGDSLSISSNSNGIVKWFEHPFDTQAFYTGTVYNTPPLYDNDTAYVRAYNEGCESIVSRLELKVNQKPNITSTRNDSVCINSLANLAAYSDIGTVRWYEDSTAAILLHEGNILQVGPLQADTMFFAQAYNKGCLSDGRVSVKALVSNDFAPTDPVTSGDTSICLLSGGIILQARATDSVRWFDVPSGGQPVHRGDSFYFQPVRQGVSKVFVDAFNGTCASSRLVINVQVDHFEKINDIMDSTCFGETLVADFSNLAGGIRWYDQDTLFLFDQRSFAATEPGQYNFLVEPYMGNCSDTMLHRVELEIFPLPVIRILENDGACRGTSGIVSLQDDGADYEWYYNNELTGTGTSLTTQPLFLNTAFTIKATRNGCESDTAINVLILKTPNANFDYQISWRNVDFKARDLNLAGYLWDVDDQGTTYTTSEFSHYYATDGDYKVTLIGTGDNGCRDTISKPVSINTLSVRNLDRAITVYPNPTSSSVFLRVPAEFKDATITIMDISGREVSAPVSAIGSGYRVDLTSCTKGVYVVSVTMNNEVSHTHIIRN